MDYHSLLREVVILMVALYSKTVKDPVILERIQYFLMGHGGEGGGRFKITSPWTHAPPPLFLICGYTNTNLPAECYR